jgi:hypothetical protein
MSKLCRIISVALIGLTPLPAIAADDDVTTKVRDLAKQAQVDTDAGHFDVALEKLTQAYELAKVPTLARNIARVLVKQGKLVEACRTYQEALTLEPNSLWRLQIQQTAQQDAARERNEVLARLPHLQLQLQGATASETTVSIDGTVLDSSLVGVDQPVNPGPHHLVGKRGDQLVENNVELKEGEHQSVVLQFASAAPPPPTAFASTEPVIGTESSGRRGIQPTLGWIGVGLGAAGLALGATTGIIGELKLSKLRDDGCRDDWCPAQLSGRVDSYNRLRTVSTIGFIAGAVVEVTGITLLLTSPRRSANVNLAVGPSHVALQGGF